MSRETIDLVNNISTPSDCGVLAHLSEREWRFIHTQTQEKIRSITNTIENLKTALEAIQDQILERLSHREVLSKELFNLMASSLFYLFRPLRLIKTKDDAICLIELQIFDGHHLDSHALIKFLDSKKILLTETIEDIANLISTTRSHGSYRDSACYQICSHFQINRIIKNKNDLENKLIPAIRKEIWNPLREQMYDLWQKQARHYFFERFEITEGSYWKRVGKAFDLESILKHACGKNKSLFFFDTGANTKKCLKNHFQISQENLEEWHALWKKIDEHPGFHSEEVKNLKKKLNEKTAEIALQINLAEEKRLAQSSALSARLQFTALETQPLHIEETQPVEPQLLPTEKEGLAEREKFREKFVELAIKRYPTIKEIILRISDIDTRYNTCCILLTKQKVEELKHEITKDLILDLLFPSEIRLELPTVADTQKDMAPVKIEPPKSKQSPSINIVDEGSNIPPASSLPATAAEQNSYDFFARQLTEVSVPNYPLPTTQPELSEPDNEQTPTRIAI